MEKNQYDPDALKFITSLNKQICTQDKFDIILEDHPSNMSPLFEKENFKDSLMANLFSTVEFLKQEINEKNEVIRNLMTLIPSTNSNFNAGDKNKNTTHVETSSTSYLNNIHTANRSNMSKMLKTPQYPPENNVAAESIRANNESLFNNNIHLNTGDQDGWDCSKEDSEFWDNNSTPITNDKTLNESINATLYEKLDNDIANKHKIDKQITEQRMISHQKYLQIKSDSANDRINKSIVNNPTNIRNNKHPWKDGTCVIVGGSTILGLNEKRMGDKFKVRGFSGAVVQDMYHYLHPLLEKNPTYVIMMVGTNDAPHKSAEEILVELLKLKKHIEDVLPLCKVIISCPTMRTDNANPQAHRVVFDLRKKLINLNIPIILNENINDDHIGKDGLHLNTHGFGKLAMNYIRYMRKC